MNAARAVVAIAVGLAIGWGLSLIPNSETIFRLVPPIGICVMAVVCFRDLARTDRRAFVSVMGPAMVVALGAAIAPYSLVPYLSLLALGFLGVFIFLGDAAWAWWWRYVLRRQVPTPEATFNYRLAVEVSAWAEAFRTSGDSRGLTKARRALARLRAIDAPDRDWSVLRDAYADLGDRWMGLIGDESGRDKAVELEESMRALEVRRQELRDRATSV